MRDATARIRSVDDARELARRRLPKGIFQYYDGGSGSDVTSRANLAAFEQVLFRPHVARWYPERDLRTTICGHELSMPVGLSSCGQLAIGHRDGECGVARAAGEASTLMFVSGATSTPIEEIMAVATGPIFYQLYYLGGRERSEAIVERVERAGVQGIVLTVDSAAPSRGPRLRPFWERARVPEGMGITEAIRFAPQAVRRPRWLADFVRDGMPAPSVAMALNDEGQPMHRFDGGIRAMYKETPRWEDIPRLRELWQGPLVVKGILRPDDARRAVAEGVDAIVVSNHGGNYLDGSMPSLRALPEIVTAVGDEIEILFDSGVRRGIDVIRALSLGARAVMLGRAYVWAHLAAGELGVRHMLELFRQQVDDGLAYLGVRSLDELEPSLLDIGWAAPPPGGPVERG
jgi:isopentenyl diphosphate isomerase/L-lactate dehydrogenase-like FMN-dependent dehydrogenase